jgi:hypothetical protein
LIFNILIIALEYYIIDTQDKWVSYIFVLLFLTVQVFLYLYNTKKFKVNTCVEEIIIKNRKEKETILMYIIVFLTVSMIVSAILTSLLNKTNII